MKVIGLFRELRVDLARSLPSIHAEQGRLEQETAEAVRCYLESGIVVFDSMEAVRDPLDNSKHIPGGSGLMSDGEWVWRQDLPYFVQRYHVGLPDAFVQHALAMRCVDTDKADVMARADEIWRIYGCAEAGSAGQTTCTHEAA